MQGGDRASSYLYVFDRRFSTAEVALHASLPVPTVKYLVTEGILRPSVQRTEGRGTGNVYSYADVLGAMSLHGIRLPNAAARPFRHLVDFWRSARGTDLAAALIEEMHAGEKRTTSKKPLDPVVLLATEKGVALDTSPAELMKMEEVSTVFCVNARDLVERLYLGSVEVLMRHDFGEPGPNGRVRADDKKNNRGAKKRMARRKKMPYPALLIEAAKLYGTKPGPGKKKGRPS